MKLWPLIWCSGEEGRGDEGKRKSLTETITPTRMRKRERLLRRSDKTMAVGAPTSLYHLHIYDYDYDYTLLNYLRPFPLPLNPLNTATSSESSSTTTAGAFFDRVFAEGDLGPPLL